VVWIDTVTSTADLDCQLCDGDLADTVIVVDDADCLDVGVEAALAARLQDNASPVRMIAGTTPTHARSVRSWLSPLRTGGVGIVLGGGAAESDLLSVRLAQLPEPGRLPGRGHLVLRGRSWPTQFALPPEQPSAPEENL